MLKRVFLSFALLTAKSFKQTVDVDVDNRRCLFLEEMNKFAMLNFLIHLVVAIWHLNFKMKQLMKQIIVHW